MSQETGTVAAPWILDVSVLTAIARADSEITRLILELDAQGQPLVLPVLALAAASLDARGGDADDALRGLEQLANAEVTPLRDTDQAAALATVIARTDLDPWDAHVAAVAGAASCPILTLDPAKWHGLTADPDAPLHIIEITDPDDDPGSPQP